MSNKRISELQLEVNPQISDLIALASDGTSKRTTLGSVLNSSIPSTFGTTTINGDLDVNGNLRVSTLISASILYESGSTIFGDSLDDTHNFNGDVTISGSLFISGTTELGGDIYPQTPQGATLGTLEKPFREIYLQSGSINIESDVPGEPSAVISNNNNNLEISIGGMKLIQPDASFVAPTGSFSYLSSSFNHIGTANRLGDTITTGSLKVSGSTIMFGDNTMTGKTSLTGSVNISGSTNLVGNTTLEGTTTLSGSVSVTGSMSVTGSVDVRGDFYHNGNKQYNYGQFYSLQTQSGSADVAYPMKFEVSDGSDGVSITNNASGLPTRITPTHSGVYNIQFSNQLGNTANSDITFDIWFRISETNVPNSNTKFSLIKSLGSGLYAVAALNFLTQINAGQYVEIMWSSAASTARFEYLGTQTTPTRPATPSIILTVTQIA